MAIVQLPSLNVEKKHGITTWVESYVHWRRPWWYVRGGRYQKAWHDITFHLCIDISFSAESDKCPITAVVMEYVDIMNQVCGQNGRKIWRTSDILKLRRDIHNLKSNRVCVFSEYQKSGMRTVKWRILDHVAGDIARSGCLFWSDAGVYEYLHTIFKQSYKKTSKRITAAMYESITIAGRRPHEDLCTTSRKRPKQNELHKKDQDMLRFPGKRLAKKIRRVLVELIWLSQIWNCHVRWT